MAHTYLEKCFSWLCRSLTKSSLLHVLAHIHHLSNSTFWAPDLSFHSFLLKIVSCCLSGFLESLSHILKPLFFSSTHIFSAESQAFPQRPIFLQQQIYMCLLQILNNCSSNTSKNVISNLFRRAGWNLSPCSQLSGSSCRSVLMKSQLLFRDASCSRWDKASQEHCSGGGKSNEECSWNHFIFILP